MRLLIGDKHLDKHDRSMVQVTSRSAQHSTRACCSGGTKRYGAGWGRTGVEDAVTDRNSGLFQNVCAQAALRAFLDADAARR